MGNRIPTLFEWAGDMDTFQKLFDSFYKKVLKDNLLYEVLKNMWPEHSKHVSHFVAKVFGGDKLYSTDDGGSHSKMIGKHIGKILSENQRKRWVDLLIERADEIWFKKRS